MTVSLRGKPIADQLNEASRAATAARAPGTAAPSLVSVHRGLDTPFRFYLRRQAKAAEAVGIRFRDEALAPGAGPAELAERLRVLDRDPAVHAVLLEHPLPPPFDFYGAVRLLRPEKDVDGVGPENLGRLVAQRPIHVPAVARAAVRIAQHYRLPLEGEPVVVLGRSETVGLPLALLLAGRAEGIHATVTIVHSRTRELARALSGARVIFSCVGRPGLLHRGNVAEGTHLVDVGISSLPDPKRPGGTVAVGDADAGSLDGWAGSLTPVPGGVGPVTVAQLMSNAVEAWRRQTGGERGGGG